MTQPAKFPAGNMVITDVFGETPSQPAGELILNTTINATDLSIVATTAIPASWPASGRLVIDGEVIGYASYAGSTFTISGVGQRGLETGFGAGAAAGHTAGAAILNPLTAQALAQIEQEIIAIEAALKGTDLGTNFLTINSGSASPEISPLRVEHSGTVVRFAHVNTNFRASIGFFSGGAQAFLGLGAEHSSTAGRLRNDGSAVAGAAIILRSDLTGSPVQFTHNTVTTANADFPALASMPFHLAIFASGGVIHGSVGTPTDPGAGVMRIGALNANHVEILGNITANPPHIRAAGSDTNITMQVRSKGTGTIELVSNTKVALQAYSPTTSSDSLLTVQAQVGSVALITSATVTDSGIQISSRGTGSVNFYTGSVGRQVFSMTDVASSVNYIRAQPSATGNGVRFDALGTDTNIDFLISAKGTGGFHAYAGGFARKLFDAIDVASAVNWIQILPNATGNPPWISAAGSDTNIGLLLTSKGTGAVTIRTGGSARLAAEFPDVPSAVNWLRVQGSATTAPIIIDAVGSDTNITFRIGAKGSGNIEFLRAGAPVVKILPNGSEVNWIQLFGSPTGNPPILSAGGSDTNIDLAIAGKGTGVINFSYAATALGGGSTATLGTIGGSGPATAGQNSWLKIQVAGSNRFIPVWA